MATRLLPQLLWSTWDKYDREEWEHHRRVSRIDHAGFVLVAVGYCFFAMLAAPDSSVPAVPEGISKMQMLATLCALYNLHVQLFALVRPSKSSEAEYHVTNGPGGRFIWMTHQIINAMAVHLLVSAAAPFVSPRLVAGTYMAAVPLGGLALFMTIQFFTLVYGLDEVQAEYKVWAERGIAMKEMDILRHLPAGILAVADVVLLKHRATLLEVMPRFPSIFLFYVIYAVLYIIWTRVNFNTTRQWQYGFLADLGLETPAWVKFGGMQCGILSVFGFILWVLAWFFPAFW